MIRRFALIIDEMMSHSLLVFEAGACDGEVIAAVQGLVPQLSTSAAVPSPEQVAELCEAEATVLLLARLGLRAGEVAAMTLDDLDWDTGIVTVSGKGQRRHPLPLSREVGEALVAYLRDARPRCRTRRVFVRIHAPHAGFAGPVAITNVVHRALARAGIDPPFKGSHLLRHSLATAMLRNGASLEEIGQILRHVTPETTQIYAKTDLAALRALAPSWPGGAPCTNSRSCWRSTSPRGARSGTGSTCPVGC